MEQWVRRLVIAAVLLYGSKVIAQPTFTCGNNVYYASHTSTQLELVDPSDASAILLGTSGVHYNAIGYNVADDYIYGIQVGAFNLVRVGSDGSATLLGTVGLPTTNSFAAGTFGPDGLLYVKQHANNNVIYGVNVNTLTVDVVVNLSVNIDMADIAYNPATGLVYGVNSNTSELVSFDLVTGVVTTIGPTGINAVFGAMYADASGLVYGQTGSSGVVGFYSFNLGSGLVTYVGFIPTFLGNSDGASCINSTVFALDYGDAPDAGLGTGTGDYQTLILENGPSHLIPNTPIIYLGNLSPDADTDGFGDGVDDNGDASDDDTEGTADEDGVSLPATFTVNANYSLDVQVTGSGFLNAWIDWNRNGNFADGTDLISSIDQAVTTGIVTISGTVPATAEAGISYARFRICTDAGDCSSSIGASGEGEVEDYQVIIDLSSEICDNGIDDDGDGDIDAADSDCQACMASFILNDACLGSTVSLDATGSMASPGSNITSYFWDLGDGNTDDQLTVGHVYNSAGDFDVLLVITDDIACVDSIMQTVTVHALPNVSMSPFETVCLNEPAIQLDQGSPPGGQYLGNGVTGGFFDPFAAGVGIHTIQYLFTDGNSCTASASEDVVVDVSDIDTSQANICAGESYQLSTGEVVSQPGYYIDTTIDDGNCGIVQMIYLTIFGGGLDTVFGSVCSTQPYILPNGSSTIIPGTYVDSFLVAGGCDSLVITNLILDEDPCFEPCILMAPTAFSPNNDGNNDFYHILTTCVGTFNSFNLRIYDRWGEKVYEGFDIVSGWDGKYKGENAPIDVYSYIVDYQHDEAGHTDQMVGIFVLVR